MMRLWFVLAALSFAGSAAAENVLMKSNGLGLAAVGMAAGAAASAALAPPPQWQGYPRGGNDGIWTPKADRSSTEWANAASPARVNCGKAAYAGLAEALKQDAKSKDPPLEGQIHLSQSQLRVTDPMRPQDGNIYDPKSVYADGRPVTCPAN